VRSKISNSGRTELGWLEPPHVLVLPVPDALQPSCHVSRTLSSLGPSSTRTRPPAPSGAEPTRSTPAWHATTRASHPGVGESAWGRFSLCGWCSGR